MILLIQSGPILGITLDDLGQKIFATNADNDFVGRLLAFQAWLNKMVFNNDSSLLEATKNANKRSDEEKERGNGDKKHKQDSTKNGLKNRRRKEDKMKTAAVSSYKRLKYKHKTTTKGNVLVRVNTTTKTRKVYFWLDTLFDNVWKINRIAHV